MILYTVIALIYFRIADRYNIIDKPNLRSSHTILTIRGAGILFPLAFVIPILVLNRMPDYYLVVAGLLAISTISFLDDIITLNNKWRLLVHFISVALLLGQTDLFSINPLYLVPAFIVVVGVINAYNFMDGINGITVFYSLVAVVTLGWLNGKSVTLLPDKVFMSLIASLIVFTFFNARKKAKCFAGDIGSISMAFILSFLVIQLIIATDDLKWILLLGVYGLDSVATIILRLLRRENIFEAHRSHFYQYLVNERKVSHLLVSLGYAAMQIVLNLTLVHFSYPIPLLVFACFALAYASARLYLEGPARLFGRKGLLP